MVLIGVVAYGASALFRAPQAPTGATALAVSGQPPSPAGSWAAGTRSAWRVPSRHVDSIDNTEHGYYDVGFSTSDAWTVNDFVGDTTVVSYGLDPKTGVRKWGGTSFRDCAKTTIDGLVPCLDSVRGSGDDDWVRTVALVDWATGVAKTEVPLTKLGLSDQVSASATIEVVGGDIVLTLPNYPDEAGDYLGDLADVLLARISADAATVRWTVKAAGCSGLDVAALPDPLQQGVFFGRFGVAVDFATGKRIFDDGVCASIAALGVARVSGGSAPASLTAPDGSTLYTTTQDDGLLRLQAPAAAPMKLVDLAHVGEGQNQTETGALMAFDPATGRPKWTTAVPVTVERWTDRLFTGSMSVLSGDRLLLQTGDVLEMIDAVSGAVRWRHALSPGTYPGLEVAGDDTIITTSDEWTEAFDAANGSRLWQLAGTAHLVLGPDGAESLLRLGGSEASSFVERLDPADRAGSHISAPTELPACPSGMTAVSWTQYSDGAILLCAQGDRFAVLFPTHPDWRATNLTFTKAGEEVTLTDGTRLRIALGGRVVLTERDGSVVMQPATKAWDQITGEAEFVSPADLKACPAGSWPISLSVYSGGWLLVCGTAAASPSSIQALDGGSLAEFSTISIRDGGYCGTSGAEQLCVYRTPAVVTRTAGGSTTQQSVSDNYFAGLGAGGAGRGTGSYGVNAPQRDASDQVRYLTQILQKSRVGRASLESAVAQVRTCRDLGSAISQLNEVAANRQELIEALESTPVDALAEGASLVSGLRRALQLSHDSDLVWVQWAQAQQADGCASGEAHPLYQQVTTMNRDVAAAKAAFVRQWNQQIAPRYGVPRFTTAQI